MKKRLAAMTMSLFLMAFAQPSVAVAQEEATATNDAAVTSQETDIEKTGKESEKQDRVSSSDTKSTAVTSQQPDFAVTAKANEKKDRITVTVKTEGDSIFVLRRSTDKTTWETVGDPRRIARGDSVVWEDLSVKDAKGKVLTYQVVSLASTGKTSPAVTIAIDKDTNVTTVAAVADMIADSDGKPKNTKELSKPSDKKPVAKKSTTYVKPASTMKSNARKEVPKTGLSGSVLPLMPWLFVGAGSIIALRKEKL